MTRTSRAVLSGIVVLLLAGVFARLGFWQLDRLAQRRARNAAWTAALRQPEIELDSTMLARLGQEREWYVNRRVHVAGEYTLGRDMVLRGRAFDGLPGVHVVTPLRIRGTSQSILVNRGWAASSDASSIDTRQFATRGTQSVHGVLQVLPKTENGGQPSAVRDGTGSLTYRRLDEAAVRKRLPNTFPLLYVQQLPAGERPGAVLRPVPVPPLDEGPHLGYAVQWFSFAAIAIVGYVLLIFRKPDRPQPR